MFEAELQDGICEFLANNSNNAFTWSPYTGYPGNESRAPLYSGEIPHTLARGIGVSYYVVQDHPTMSHDIAGVQIMVRGAKQERRDALWLTGTVFDILHGVEHVQIGGHPVTQVWRQSMAPLGFDENAQFVISSNYYVRVDRYIKNRMD